MKSDNEPTTSNNNFKSTAREYGAYRKAAHRAEFYKNPFNQLVQRCETAATAEAMEAVSEFCQDLLARVERLENRKQRPIKEANIEDL